jgi:predicted metal-binding protein
MAKPDARPVATPAFSVPQSAPHQILVCQTCRHKDRACLPGLELMDKLRAALATAALDADFEVSGTACMAGCDHPCTVAWRATAKATYLFGDIDPDQDIDDLVAFAHLYQRLEDGWCRAEDRPGKLAEHVLARIPAALIVMGGGLQQ